MDLSATPTRANPYFRRSPQQYRRRFRARTGAPLKSELRRAVCRGRSRSSRHDKRNSRLSRPSPVAARNRRRQQSIMFGLETHRLDDGVLAARLQYRFTEILLAVLADDDRENVMGRWSGGARQFVFTIAHIASLLGSFVRHPPLRSDENKYGTKRTLVKVRRLLRPPVRGAGRPALFRPVQERLPLR